MHSQSVHDFNFPLIMAKYASQNTDLTFDYFYELFIRHKDNLINYLLRTTIPARYTFDGLKETFVREETETTVDLVAVFYFLENGRCLTTAIQYSASVAMGKIEYGYSILPKKEFDALNSVERSLGNALAEYRWPQFTTGII